MRFISFGASSLFRSGSAAVLKGIVVYLRLFSKSSVFLLKQRQKIAGKLREVPGQLIPAELIDVTRMSQQSASLME